MVLSRMIYFSLQKACLPFFGEKKTGGPFGPTTFFRSPMNLFPSAVLLSSTLKSYPEPHKLLVIHASSTIEFGTPRIDFLALFVYPPPSNLIRSPMNLLPSVVHVSSTIESGALRSYCVALFANSPFSIFFRSPLNLLPSAVHASSTFESEAPRSYCVALFANSPFSTFYSETHEFIA